MRTLPEVNWFTMRIIPIILFFCLAACGHVPTTKLLEPKTTTCIECPRGNCLGAIELTYLGAAGFRIEHKIGSKKDVLLLSPFFSNPAIWKLLTHLEPNRKAISYAEELYKLS